jgi:signal peptidase I
MALGLLPHLGLYRPATVLSGSMRPTFNPGDLLVVRPEPLRDVRVGQVISYTVPVGDHRIETHRVIRIVQGGDHPVVQTQGDANNWRDPSIARLQGTTAWRLSVVIPNGGYVISTMRSHTLHTLSIVVVPVALALLFLSYLWGLPAACAVCARTVHAPSVHPRRLLVVGCALAALLGSASIAEAQFTASPSSGRWRSRPRP